VLEILPIVDWVILGIIAVSAVISLVRGFVREALSLATLIGAIVIARVFGSQVATLFDDYISQPSFRLLAANALLFVTTMIVGGMLNHLVAGLIDASGLTGTDRLLGAIFGLARGALIIVIAVAVLSRMPVTEDPWWKASKLIPAFVDAAASIENMIFASRGRGEQAT